MRLRDALASVRTEAVPCTGTAEADLSKGWEAATSLLPQDAHAVIHCPAPSVMTSGRARTGEWVLEFEPRARPVTDPLMGWIGSSDPLTQIRLRFPSSQAAIGYADRQGLHYQVREPTHLLSRWMPRPVCESGAGGKHD